MYLGRATRTPLLCLSLAIASLRGGYLMEEEEKEKEGGGSWLEERRGWSR